MVSPSGHIVSPSGHIVSSAGHIVYSSGQKAADLAHERDGRKCILTGSPVTDVAHIIPHCILKHGAYANTRNTQFWSTLYMFFKKEKVEKWMEALYPTEGRPGKVSVDNLLTLATDVHRMWDESAIALKPIRSTEVELELELHVLPRMARKAGLSLTTVLESSEGRIEIDMRQRAEGPPEVQYVFNRVSKRNMRTGDRVVTTDDPKLKPLPRFELMELQWVLHRVTARFAAAEEFDSEDTSDELAEDDATVDGTEDRY
ncbi:hypothetical protein EJ06DRAFT_576504 [Trichodelitschia bisporula]|uniref:HNH nuclease domain-containing protein n=1 Tax=Trichodelitschia bisporula TaxID=703511 RepID=A0A6G1I0I7_9PEZI|nr:hypothetical protein EJ06DRAFT_576504 [Trichodelitschia bisporula]